MPLTPSRAEDEKGPRARLYLVATSHLDTQWRWTIQTTIRHFLQRTLLDNFERMRAYPNYALSFEGAFRYQLIEEHYPREFQRLVDLVHDRRWHPAGGMLDAPDTNLPSPESLIRHLLYGNDYFESKFGRRCVDLFLPDCFGFPWSLPTLAAHCGIEGFSSQKHGRWMAPAKLPFDIGLWQGPDGATIVAVLDPGGYGRALREDVSRSPVWRDRIEKRRRQTGLAVGYGYFGLGDRGGAPDRTSLDYLERSLAGDGDLEVVHGASDQFFRDLSLEDRARLPVHRGDLLLPTHGTGCWTSHAVVKKWNRRCELLADAAERAGLAAHWLDAAPYPADELRREWTRFLWHQMHDDLTGTSSPEAYRYTWNDLVLTQNRLSTLLRSRVAAVARGLDTTGEGTALVVFNALGFERRALVDTWVRFDTEPPSAVRVLDPDEQEVSCQILDRRGLTLRLLFPATVPPVGFAVFQVVAAAEAGPASSGLEISARGLENDRYRVRVDDAGAVESLFDKQLGRELLREPMDLCLLPDRSTRWPAWEIRYEDVCSQPLPLGATPEFRIVERGPVRVRLEITRAAGASRFRQSLALAAGEDGHRLEVSHQIAWRTSGKLLKAVFPAALDRSQAVATYDMGLGSIEREPNTRAQYEVPAHEWADLSGPDWGLSILSRHTYGWDRPDPNTLRLSLLRSPKALRRFAHQATQDFGRHSFCYALAGHATRSTAAICEQGADFNQPLFPFRAAPHPGVLGRRFSLLRLDGDAQLMALKKSERSDRWLARFRETGGSRSAEVTLSPAGRLAQAELVDGCERHAAPIASGPGGLNMEIPGFAPRTVRLTVAEPARLRLPSYDQAPITLDFDTRATSCHGEASVDFDGHGFSLPAEHFPGELLGGSGVAFSFGSRASGAANALACRGQTLALPGGGYDRLAFVAASTDAEGSVVAFSGNSAEPGDESAVRIPYYSGFVGQWKRFSGRLGFLLRRFQPGFIERTPVIWECSHRHDRRVRDQVYTYCYLFEFELPIAPEARFLKLPQAPAVKLFAATAAKGANWSLEPGATFYD